MGCSEPIDTKWTRSGTLRAGVAAACRSGIAGQLAEGHPARRLDSCQTLASQQTHVKAIVQHSSQLDHKQDTSAFWEETEVCRLEAWHQPHLSSSEAQDIFKMV